MIWPYEHGRRLNWIRRLAIDHHLCSSTYAMIGRVRDRIALRRSPMKTPVTHVFARRILESEKN